MSAAATASPRTLLSVFTPSQVDPVILERLTVGRAHELSALKRAIDETASSDARPHTLLVGSRGSGKSHLLALAAHHVRTATPPGSAALAWLPEDVYSITTYRDLLAEILLQATGARPSSQLSERDLEALVRSVSAAAPIVTIIENLDRNLDLIGRDGQEKLRSLLHNEHALLLLASTPSLFEGVTSHAQPFYGAFRVLPIGELTPEDGRELLLRLAKLNNDDVLGTFLATESGLARVSAIAHLAGGSPRLWTILAGCVTVPLLDELVPLVAKILDDLMPYYRARMDELPPAKAKLVSTLCFARGGGAMTVKELADYVGGTQQSTSKLLHELERDRFVRGAKASGTDQRMTYYEVREPLLRHCLEQKSSRGRPLSVIVSVLRSWHDSTQHLPVADHVARIGRIGDLVVQQGERLSSAVRDTTAEPVLAELSDVPALGAIVGYACSVLAERDIERLLDEVVRIGRTGELTAVVGMTARLDDVQLKQCRALARVLSTLNDGTNSILHDVLSAAIASHDGDGRPLAQLPSEQRRLAVEIAESFGSAHRDGAN